jgi:hypothetical protein
MGSPMEFPYLVPHSDKPGKSLQENVPDYPNKVIFSRERKHFLAVDTLADLFMYIFSKPDHERNFYEVIQEGWQKLHFDIDIKSKPGIDYSFAESVKDHLVKGICSFFLANVEQPFFLKNDLILFTSHGSKNFSYHIVIDNFAFPGSIHCKDITMKIIDSLPEEMQEYIDISVNKSNQQFRVWRNFKEGEWEQRRKEISQEWKYFGETVIWEPRQNSDKRWTTPGLPDNIIEFLYFERTFVSKFVTPPIAVYYRLPNLSTRAEVIYEDFGEINGGLLQTLIPEGWIVSSQSGNFFKLISDRKHECPLCSRIHEKENQYILVISGKQNVFFKCFRTTHLQDRQSIFLGSLNPDYEYTIEDQQAEMERIRVKSIRADYSYNLPHVEKLNPIPWTVMLVQSYLGTGKTSTFIKYVRENNPDRVLILSPRQTFARSICAEFNVNKPHLPDLVGEPFQCYLDVRGDDISKCNRLVLQMESLHRLLLEDRPFDVLILDEVESLLKQFSSTRTMKKLIQCAHVFERLIRTTKIIIGGDAFLTLRSVNVLKQINQQVTIIRNDFPPVARQAFIYPFWEMLVYRAFQSLSLGKKIVFVCMAKQKAISFAEECRKQGITYKLYTGDSVTKQQDQDDLANVNEAWSNIQCLIYTSTITVGVNFDRADVFDQLFAYGSSFSCCVRELGQALLRVRHIRENVLHMAVFGRSVDNNLYTKREDIKFLIQLKAAHNWALADRHIEKPTVLLVNVVDPLTNKEELQKVLSEIWSVSPLWLQTCTIENILEDNLSMVKYPKVLDTYLKRCNYTVKNVTSMKKDLPPSDHVYKYYDIPDITRQVYNSLQTKNRVGLANEIELKMIEKYSYKRMIREDIPESLRAELYNHYFGTTERDKRSHFYNAYSEKFLTVQSLLEKEIRDKFVEASAPKPLRLEVIRELNDALGISNSFQGFTKRSFEFIPLKPVLDPILDKATTAFGTISEARSDSLYIAHCIQKIYKSWNGTLVKKSRDQSLHNGQRINDAYILSTTTNSTLWDCLSRWTETNAPSTPEITIPVPSMNFFMLPQHRIPSDTIPGAYVSREQAFGTNSFLISA